jgi:hypothetical protein
VLRRATAGAVVKHLGLAIGDVPDRCFDIVVVCERPAGLAAVSTVHPGGADARHREGRGRRTRARTSSLPFETSRPGLFAVDDLRSGSVQRVAAAVGERPAVVRAVHEYLASGS